MSRAALALLVLLAVAGCTDSSRDLPREFTLAASQSHDCGEGYIVFVRGGLVHRMRADGTDVLPLTNDPVGSERSPRWSPDGRRIAFLREGDLWIMDADGRNAAMALSSSFFRLAWSPDGRYIAAAPDAGGPVTVYDVDSGGVASAGQPVVYESVTWSPDGRWLLYVGDAELRVVRPDGTDDMSWFDVERSVSDVAWSPDPGHYIAVVRGLDRSDQVEILDRNSGLSQGFVPFGGDPEADEYRDPFWSPDYGCLGVTIPSQDMFIIRDLSTGDERIFAGEMGDWVRSIGDAPPVASFTATPETAAIGELVTFDASKSTDDFGIVKYVWDFLGDGTLTLVDTAPVTKHAYDVPGSYKVGLIVRDTASREAETTRAVTVVGDGMVTLTIEFGAEATGSVRMYVDGLEVAPCMATCHIQTPVGAKVKLVPDGKIDAWTGCDQDLGALGCELTMDADRTVLGFVLPPS